MPYLRRDERGFIDLQLPEGISFGTKGALNYALTRVAIQYIEEKGLSYSAIADVMGAFACAAQEFYRRVAADYEDLKIVANGDVYPLSMVGIPRGN